MHPISSSPLLDNRYFDPQTIWWRIEYFDGALIELVSEVVLERGGCVPSSLICALSDRSPCSAVIRSYLTQMVEATPPRRGSIEGLVEAYKCWRMLPTTSSALENFRIRTYTGGHDAFGLWLMQQVPDYISAPPNTTMAQLLLAIERAMDLAIFQAGEFSTSVFCHSTVIVGYRGDSGKGTPQAFSLAKLPGMIFVDADWALQVAPQILAEALLHEALHSKLFDIYVAYNILSTRYSADQSKFFYPPWHAHKPGVSWPFDQALGAAHVYSYLCYFYTIVAPIATKERSRSECANLDGWLEGYHVRRNTLLDWLLQHCEHHVTSSGRVFVKWLATSASDS